MLDQATRYARSARRYERGTAAVLLDAVVERVTVLVLVANGRTVKSADKLDDLTARTVELLAGRWLPKTLSEVRLLRRARNAAQHEGLAPDSQQMPGWITAVEAYVLSLVEAQFDADLRRIALADAIADAELRKSFATGAEALASGDLEVALREFNRTFTSATGRWARLHKRHRRDQFFDTTDRSTQSVDRKIERLAQELRVVAVAADASEAHWYLEARVEGRGMLDRDEVERVQGFVFSWVSSYETAVSTWVPDRNRRAAIARRLQAEGGESPSIQEVTARVADGSSSIHVVIAGVPSVEYYDAWAEQLGDVLRGNSPSRQPWQLNVDGTASLLQVSLADVTERILELRTALEGIDRLIEQARLKRLHAKALADSARSNYEARLDVIRGELPAWVERVILEEVDYKGSRLRLQVSEEVASLVWYRGPVGAGGRRTVGDAIRDHPAVTECYGLGDYRSSDWGVSPVLDPAVLLEVLLSVEEEVRAQVATHALTLETEAALERDLVAAAKSAIDAGS